MSCLFYHWMTVGCEGIISKILHCGYKPLTLLNCLHDSLSKTFGILPRPFVVAIKAKMLQQLKKGLAEKPLSALFQTVRNRLSLSISQEDLSMCWAEFGQMLNG